MRDGNLLIFVIGQTVERCVRRQEKWEGVRREMDG
jgi:hypothetical protein